MARVLEIDEEQEDDSERQEQSGGIGDAKDFSKPVDRIREN